MSNKGVRRAAPATPGLFNTVYSQCMEYSVQKHCGGKSPSLSLCCPSPEYVYKVWEASCLIPLLKYYVKKPFSNQITVQRFDVNYNSVVY